ncbi:MULTISPECIES: hypothetical protein [unclassified Burkholderia]|uniref:hypothetical protein n=1 Tax=unclassified Burkholderia TaxID=2613784 RepID=UPI00197EBC3F|nr:MULTISPECIES: hypothetical protein [unclassified Burkholderia]
MHTLHNHSGSRAPLVDDAGHLQEATGPALVDSLVCANRILFDLSIVDAFGYVSVSHDKDPQCHLLARDMAPGTVCIDYTIEFTLSGPQPRSYPATPCWRSRPKRRH